MILRDNTIVLCDTPRIVVLLYEIRVIAMQNMNSIASCDLHMLKMNDYSLNMPIGSRCGQLQLACCSSYWSQHS
jgi:hypothetical protein